MKIVTVKMLHGKWTADKVRDGEILRSIINASGFLPNEYERVLAAISEAGFILETL